MASIENNNEDWRELRSRVDSIANAVFLISGGALSLSMSVILGNKGTSFITNEVSALAAQAWYFLLFAVLLFVFLKSYLVFLAFLLQTKPAFLNRHLGILNGIGWVLGIAGFLAFSIGFFLMVRAAVVAVHA